MTGPGPAPGPATSPEAGPLLEVDHLTVRLRVEGRPRSVLRDVALRIGAGEAVGLVGESGSGKSMTARAIGRLLPEGAATEGTVRFQGADVAALAGSDLRRYRSQVAMIFQDPRAHINPVRRIGDFMTEALRTNAGVKKAEAYARAADMLSQVGLESKLLARYPHELSGGMLQRGSTLRKRLEHRLKSAVPGGQVRSEPVIAARGAVRAAHR